MLSKRGDFIQDFSESLASLSLLVKNITGDTKLHCLIREGASLAAIQAYLSEVVKIDKNAASAMATTVNNAGSLPIDLLPTPDLNPEAEKISSLLYSHMPEFKAKSLSEKLDFSAILKPYKNQLSARLEANFQLAFFAAVEARKIIKKSYTHPEMNNSFSWVKAKLTSDIEKMRVTASKLSQQIRQDNVGLNEQDLKIKILEQLTSLYSKKGIGNCEEYSLLALHFTIKKDPSVQAEIFNFGDHAFVVLGRDPKSNPRDFRTWGKEAVVCDPWAGTIYPAFAIPERLLERREFDIDNREVIIGIKFNRQFHKLILDHFIRPLDSIEQAPASTASKVLPTQLTPAFKNPEPCSTDTAPVLFNKKQNITNTTLATNVEELKPGSKDLHP